MKTEDEKQKLIEAINCKFPQNNIMELFYNIGRVLPFTAQRFPDGRVSDWYRNQYVQVVRVEPKGKYGKYCKAFGFYYRRLKKITISPSCLALMTYSHLASTRVKQLGK